MSDFLGYFPASRPRRRRWPWLIAAVLVVLAVAAAIVVVTGGSRRGAVTSAAAPPVSASRARPPGPPPDAMGTVTWTPVLGVPLPVSAVHGPRSDAGGVPSGYSHDAAGAALAAINISYRLTGAVGPGTYQAVLFQQCYGNVDATVQQLTASSSASTAAEVTPDQWWWRVTAGDPSGDLVQVSVLARTPQSAALGGFSEIERTVAWRGGDWRMQVPPSPPALVSSTAGYTLLGPR